jgi:hypothetical protein
MLTVTGGERVVPAVTPVTRETDEGAETGQLRRAV